MGWTDTSVEFHSEATDNNEYFQTPNMEWLAEQGVKFTNAYSASTVSSPTRTSLLNGMNPAKSKITNWIAGEGKQAADRTKHSIPEWNKDGLKTEDQTLVSFLKSHNYITAHIGKAHLGRRGTEGAEPLNLGFDIYIGGYANGQPASFYVPYGKDDHPFKVKHLEDLYADSLYLNDALTVKATALIDQFTKGDKPFFLHMAHYALHTPIQGDTTLLYKYKRDDKNIHAQHYATMVESMDKSLGEIISKLKEKNILDNTIILFMSDNGGLISHTGPPTSNFPLRSGKGSSYEGGTRVPMIAYWPEKIKGNTISDEIVVSYDIYPTLIEQLTSKEDAIQFSKKNAGKSLIPIFEGGKFEKDRVVIWHYPHYWANLRIRNADPGIHPYSAIREGNWKLIYNYDNEEIELYNLKSDLGETNNLVEVNSEIAKELCKKLSDYLIEVNAQLPINRETNEEVAYPHL